ncbi:MAG: DUF4276 family protein [Chloroflexota bacterium]
MNVKIYVEGGGDDKELLVRCQIGFRKLIEKSGFKGRMPRIVSCGGRGAAFDDFKNAIESMDTSYYPILLVDSEDPISSNTTKWDHLRGRDKWDVPKTVSEDQAQLMVTCMETWLMADRAALRSAFGAELQENALLPEINLEQYDRHRVQGALEHATRNCGNRAYKKGKRSFQVLEAANPNTLKERLPYFRRFIETLERLLHPK